MSNSYAIMAVTATIWHILSKNGIKVSTDPPDTESSSDARINIFLFHLASNPGYRNLDLPARGYGGELVTKQRIGLDLSYLMTAYGTNDDELASQKILVDAVRLLNENSVLTPDLIRETMADANVQRIFPDVAQVDLASQLDPVKLNMAALSLEDLTKIWSSFFKTKPYRLSFVYKATVAIIDGVQQPRSTMPVRMPKVYVSLTSKPEITYVTPQMAVWLPGNPPNQPAGWQVIKVVGRNLLADDVRIDFGDPSVGLDSLPKPDHATNEEIVITIPKDMSAGIKQLRVVHPLDMGEPPKLHRGPESNVALFALTPVISDPPSIAARTLTIRFQPALKPGQKAQVIIGTFRPLEGVLPDNNSMRVDIPSEFNAGTYPVRLRVDGVESQPDDQTWSNEYKRPTVTIA